MSFELELATKLSREELVNLWIKLRNAKNKFDDATTRSNAEAERMELCFMDTFRLHRSVDKIVNHW